MVIGCVRVTDVSVIDTIRSYENGEYVGVGIRCSAYYPAERLLIDSNGKNKNYTSRRGPLGREFSAFVMIAELWQPEVARPGNFVSNFAFFLEKRPLMVKFSKLSSVSLHGDTDWRFVFKCSKLFPTENWWNRAFYISQKIRLSLKLSLLRGSRLKSAKASPQHLANIVPDFIQIGSLSAEL